MKPPALTTQLPAPETVALTRRDAGSGFRCGVEALDTYFKQFASSHQSRNASKTWVLHAPADRPDLPRVLGYYTLSGLTLERNTLPPEAVQGLPPRYPVLCYLLARLARDERARGVGVGERLMDDAHLRVLLANEQAGGVLLVVDAKDQRASDFYVGFGYTPLLTSQPSVAAPAPEPQVGEPEASNAEPAWPKRLYVRIADLRASYAAAESSP
jgi:GNAT superfamily N-acetyltransferase